jgi:hypothetical protein
MKILFALTGLLLLAGCGVDGAPIRPSLNTQITIDPDGVSTKANLGLTRGNLKIGLGL